MGQEADQAAATSTSGPRNQGCTLLWAWQLDNAVLVAYGTLDTLTTARAVSTGVPQAPI